jgi:hypothetical protein
MVALRLQTQETLILLIEKANKLRASRFVAQMLDTGGSLHWSWKQGEAHKFDWAGPEDEALEAFILTFRFFIQNNERTSFGSLEKISDDPAVSTYWKQEYNRVRATLNQHLDEPTDPMTVCWQNHIITRREVMDVFIYGGLAHATREKRQAFEDWRTNSGVFPMFQYEFMNILMEILMTIRYLAYLSEHELNPSGALAWMLHSVGVDLVDDPERFVDCLADRIAWTSEQPQAAAKHQVGDMVIAARQEYHDAGAVYGYDMTGFVVWVSQRAPVRPLYSTMKE